jgi:nucleoporin NUP42
MASPSTSGSFPTAGKGKVAAGPPDFANAKSGYQPGATPYDQQLPPNYISVLPPLVLEAFKGQKFEWGKVPEWVPPLELR